MTEITLKDLQESVQDERAFKILDDYLAIGLAFLTLINETQPTRIVSPSHPHYIFYQFGQEYGHRITRPLNTHLLITSATDFKQAFERFITFLGDLEQYHEAAVERDAS